MNRKISDAVKRAGQWTGMRLRRMWRMIRSRLPGNSDLVALYRNLEQSARKNPREFALYTAWGILSFLVVPVMLLSMVYAPEVDASKIRVTTDWSFLATGQFTLEGLEGLKLKDIRENLELNPPTAFQVEKTKAGKYVNVTVTNPRNIGYQVIYHTPEGETLTMELNGPPLSVSIGNTTSYLQKNSELKLVFTEQVDIYSLEENLTIEPKTAYTLAYNLNTVTVTPKVEWITTDNYQVKIDADYASKTGKQFADHQVLSFRVTNPAKAASAPVSQPRQEISFQSGNNYVLNTGSDMSMLFYGSNLNRSVPVLVETWRMDSLEKYREQGHIYLDFDLRLDSLEKLDTNAFLIGNGESTFDVPSFGEGAYILSATYTDPRTGQEKEVRTSYFITSMSVYLQTSRRETVVWLNGAGQEAPLSGYRVEFTGGREHGGVTDEQGLLILDHEEDADLSAFSIFDPEGTLVYYDDSRLSSYGGSYTDRYYSYLFLDRTLYRPEDTVNFWGFIRPYRYNQMELPDTVTVRFDPGGLDLEVEVELAESGVFTGEIPLERIKSTQYAIQAELYFPPEEEDQAGLRHTIETEYVSVKEFEKPTFVLSSNMDQDWYGPEDDVRVVASVAFYDGTPLPFYPVEAAWFNPSTWSWVHIKDLETDSSGKVTFSFPASPGGQNLGSDRSPRSNRYMVQIANDGEQVTHIRGYTYLPSDILVESSVARQRDGDNLELTVRTWKLDAESQALANAMSGVDPYGITNSRLLEIARGPAVDAELEIGLNWDYYDSRDIRHRNRQSNSGGSYIRFENSYSLDYEVVENREIPVIEDWETMEKRISVSTTNGVAVVRDLIYKPEDSVINFDNPITLRASVSYADTLGNDCSTSAGYPTATSYSRDDPQEEQEPDPIPGYSFQVTDASGADKTPDTVWYEDIYLNAGEEVEFRLLLDSVPVEGETPGRMLYTVIQEGLYERQIISGTSFRLPIRTAYARSARLVAVWFDGTETFYVKQLELNVNGSSMQVDIEVTPDRADYRPGEDVSLQVRATDYLGRGVAGNLCVAVVDESIFALSEQYVEVYSGLYKDMYLSNSVQQYCTTYRDIENTPWYGDGGKGGGGGVEFYDSYRSNFKDTALFLPFTTDASGSAQVRFTLPDNTTSWRITTVAVDNELRGGESKSNIISTLPFFVKPVLTSKYIDGDDIAMLVQGHGTLLQEGDDIDYIVTLTGDETSITLAGSGKAYEAMEFNFGKLPMGEYTVVSRAQYSGYADTVELPLSVIKSNLELVIHQKMDVADLSDISAMRYPVTISLYDRDNEAFFASINSLFGHYCMQASQRLSRFVAKRVIRQTVEDGRVPYYIAEGNDYVSDMQNSDGGIAAYPGGNSQPLITTYVLLVAKDNFNLRSMERYYRSQLDTLSDPKLRAACYLGLAAMEGVTAAELEKELKKSDLPLDARAYLIAGMAYLGETGKAQRLYTAELAPHLESMNDGVKKDVEWERDAAAIWIAASRLGHEDADRLSLHFGSARWRYRTLFECMIYVTNYDRDVTATRFTYSVKGTERQVNLGMEGRMHTMVLSKSDLESLRFPDPPESLQAVAYYVGEPSEIGLEQSENMRLDKSIRRVDDNTYEVALDIHLTKDAPTGEYDISDWVPSNTRLYSVDKSCKSGTDKVSFSTTEEGQKLYISFQNDVEKDRTIRFTYRVRQTFRSEAVLDTTYMIHGDSGENCNTEKSLFQPKSSEDAAVISRENSDEPTRTALKQEEVGEEDAEEIEEATGTEEAEEPQE